MNTTESPWKALFRQWPETMPRRGVLITTLNEQIPFNGFMTTEDFVVVSRAAPDAIGARSAIVPYTSLSIVKMTDVVKSDVYRSAGFVGELGRQ